MGDAPAYTRDSEWLAACVEQTLQHASSRLRPESAGTNERGTCSRVRARCKRRPAYKRAMATIRWVDTPQLDLLYRAHVQDLAQRYGRVLEDTGWDAIAVHSGSLRKRSDFDDQTWPLRPVPHWQHWLPLAEPDGLLVVRAGARPKLVRSTARSFWENPPAPETEAFADLFDVTAVLDPDQARTHLGQGRVAFVGESASLAGAWGVDAAPPGLLAALDALRVIKTPYEVECLAEANRRARPGHAALRDAFGAGDASELDLHLLYLQVTAQDDWETPYKNIVALGPHAATLHHVAYGRRGSSREAESLLVDAGATCRGYGADVTRTWVRGRGEAATLFGRLLAGVEAMQQRLCGAVRLGLPYEQLHDDAHVQVAAILRDAGVLRVSLDEAVATGLTRAFFPHGLGHSLGLQTHDVGCALRRPRADNPFLRNTTDIATGQVFTIEPGIYFIDDLLAPLRASGRGAAAVNWAAVDVLSALGGVRIEDDVHVVGGSAVIRNLTRESEQG